MINRTCASYLAMWLLYLATCCQLQAQIKIAPEYSSGQPVVVEVAFPETPDGAQAHLWWSVGGDAGYAPICETHVHIWPRYGPHDQFLTIRCTGFLTTTNSAGEQVFVQGSHREFEATTKILAVEVGPPGPGPGPGPEPKPDPKPVPDNPAPIPDAGFRVLMVVETEDLAKLPAGVQLAISAKAVRDYLAARCAKGADGRTPEWRYFDDNQVVAAESPIWQKAMSRQRVLSFVDASGKRTPQAWCVISNGVTGYEGPIPPSVDEFLKLLQKYGG